MKFQDYAFTLRKTKTRKVTPTEATYKDHIERIFTKNDLIVYDYGFETERGLHVHGVVELKGPFLNNTRRLKFRGWNLHLTPITDMQGWIRYYNKTKSLYINIDGDVEYEPTPEDHDAYQKYRLSVCDDCIDQVPELRNAALRLRTYLFGDK